MKIKKKNNLGNLVEELSCMGIVIAKDIDEKKVLILNNEGEWVFPKGHVEENENHENTAIREIYEESGVEVELNDCRGLIDEFSFYFESKKVQKNIKVFLFEIDQIQEIKWNKNEYFIDGKWVSIPDAINQLKHDNARNALRKCLEKINANKSKQNS